MPVITNTNSATVSFGKTDTVSIQAGSGFARWECPVGTVVAEFSGSRTFGPFSGTSGKITALVGDVFYEVQDLNLPLANTQTALNSNVPYILAQSGVPVILISSGTVNSSGGFSGLTALPYTPSGTVLVYIFAGIGLTAGLYQATFSSTTACQLVGNPTTTAGAYAGGTTQAILASVTVPGGAMGPNGALRITTDCAVPANANQKTLRHNFNSNSLGVFSQSSASVSGMLVQSRYANAASTQTGGGSQQWINGSAAQAGGGTRIRAAINTDIDRLVDLNGQLAVATDYIILEGHTVEVLPGA